MREFYRVIHSNTQVKVTAPVVKGILTEEGTVVLEEEQMNKILIESNK